MDPSRAYARPLTLADLPDEVRALLDRDAPLEEPPQQGRTSRVAFALGVDGVPVVIKRSGGAHLDLLRREVRALRALEPLGVPAPEPRLFLERPTPFGPEGWLVTRRWSGTTLEAALRTEADPVRRADLLRDFGAVLARLHVTPPPPGFGSADWFERALADARRLNPMADAARFERLRNERPALPRAALIHGDLFLDNVLTADGHVTGFIDWAFADIGDPRYDLAVATHELTAADRDAFAEGYGPSARLTDEKTAYFVEVALLF